MTRRQHGLPDPVDDDAFTQRVRTGLLTTASSVEPDPAGWRQLNARIRRRQAVVRGGGLALAGVAAALVAVTVLPGGGVRVELAPGPVADSVVTAPALPDAPTATPSDPPVAVPSAPTEEEMAPEAAGILFSDGSSIHVADLSGTVLHTPVQASSSTITDVVVLPGSTVEDLTAVHRWAVPDGSDDDCGDLSWARVVDGVADGGPAGLPGMDTYFTGECRGAPVFASDGSALGWLAETMDGEVQLQTVDWTDEGPVEGSRTTWGLDPKLDASGLLDPQLLEWTLGEPISAGVSASGALVVRGTGADGLRTYRFSIQRQADGALALPPGDTGVAELVHETDIGGTIIDAHLGWRLVRLPTADAEERVGLATATREVDGERLPPMTAETELLLDVDARPYLDVLGDTAVIGVGQAMFVVQAEVGDAEAPGSLMIDGDLPPATSAALLAAP